MEQEPTWAVKLRELMEKIWVIISGEKPDVTPKPEVEKPMIRNKAILLQAAGEIGQKEIVGTKDNPRVNEYHLAASKENDKPFKDDVPWCASFVCWVLEKVGMGSTNSKMARSYEKWGVPIHVDAYLPGDIVVYFRNGLASGQGHVGFILKISNGMVYTLGGNQSNSVNITRYSLTGMTSIRRSSKAGVYTEAEIADLRRIAEQILAGEKVEEAGSVA